MNILYPISHLLTPGPTPMPEAVRQATGQPMVHHRSDAFCDLLRDVTAELKTVFQTEHDVLILTGSSTGAMEAAVVNTLSPGDRVLAASAGRFGERWADIAQAFGTDVTRLRFPDGQAADPAAIQEALSEGRPFQALLITHNQTSTGVTNDLAAVGAAVGAMPAERRPLLLVDAVSSLGALELRTDDWGCDVVVSGSQKALMSPPGVATVAVGPAVNVGPDEIAKLRAGQGFVAEVMVAFDQFVPECRVFARSNGLQCDFTERGHRKTDRFARITGSRSFRSDPPVSVFVQRRREANEPVAFHAQHGHATGHVFARAVGPEPVQFIADPP